ncbi:MAG: 4-hydroxy-tetrahydrodipicolinate reductase [Myxococcales bacterium]|nr:4-hydroxy-tetrahydrodipicolinate reductase [Myxococcales bacterium]
MSSRSQTVAPTRLAIVGPNGRMGAALVALGEAEPGAEVTAKVIPLGEQGGVLLADVDPSQVDVLIDFSHREAAQAHAAWCAAHGIAWVLGTTGLTAEDNAAIDAAAAKVIVFQASNFSLGVALLTDLAARAARVLGLKADVELVETHHHFKRDAPSGTALSLAEAVAEARGQHLPDVIANGRDGLVGERPQGQIGMHAVRLADVVGKHELHFGWGNESVVLTHEARDRRVFAHGAIRAAMWCAQLGSAHGKRSMGDLLAAS